MSPEPYDHIFTASFPLDSQYDLRELGKSMRPGFQEGSSTLLVPYSAVQSTERPVLHVPSRPAILQGTCYVVPWATYMLSAHMHDCEDATRGGWH